LQKNKYIVISILAALLACSAISVAAAQEPSQADPTQPNSIPPTPALQSSKPVEGDQYAPGVGAATTTGPDGITTNIANVTSPMPLIDGKDIASSDVDGNGSSQATTGQNGDSLQEPGNGEVVPIYALYENTADNSSTAAAATAVGLVVAALAMGAVGIVCLGKHS
jgi:hypothetical protein